MVITGKNADEDQSEEPPPSAEPRGVPNAKLCHPLYVELGGNSLSPDEVQHTQGDAPEMVFRGFIGVPLYTHDGLIGWSVTRVVNLSLRVQ